jgi:FecR protein
MSKMTGRSFLALGILGLVAVSPAHAQTVDGIGAASTISNRVEGFVGGDARALAVGSEVFRNELVRTGLQSDAKLIFLDDTNLSVGPASEVTLDRFVYDPDKSAGAVVVKTTKGIFRFVTGSQRPQNYVINTPIASIGVRGTIFDLLVLPDRVTVILIEGQILVTTLFNRTITLSQPGMSITVYANGRVVGPAVWRGSVYVDFASANFPYFPPVTAIKRKASVPPNVRTATETPRNVERPKRNPGYRLSSRESDPGVRVRIPIPKVDRPPRQRETKHYPPPKKQYPNQNQKKRRYN